MSYTEALENLCKKGYCLEYLKEISKKRKIKIKGLHKEIVKGDIVKIIKDAPITIATNVRIHTINRIGTVELIEKNTVNYPILVSFDYHINGVNKQMQEFFNYNELILIKKGGE